MTEEEFASLDIAKDLTNDQFKSFKSLIMQYRDILYFTAEDQNAIDLNTLQIITFFL
jgi:hypothetical protein